MEDACLEISRNIKKHQIWKEEPEVYYVFNAALMVYSDAINSKITWKPGDTIPIGQGMHNSILKTLAEGLCRKIDKKKLFDYLERLEEIGVVELFPPDLEGEVRSKRYEADLYIRKERVRKKVFEKDGRYCNNCGHKENLTLDHKTPVARGGENEIKNLQVLCRKCNSSKSDKTMQEWRGEEQ